MIDRTPPEAPPKSANAPGARGTYGQGDFALSAQRDRLRKDQHFACRSASSSETPDPYGEGGFAAGGDGQSGYGADYGQLEPSQRHERHVSEHDIRNAGTSSKSDR
jgi:hypothetical protein